MREHCSHVDTPRQQRLSATHPSLLVLVTHLDMLGLTQRKKDALGTGKKTPLVKFLPYKREDLSLVSGVCIKTWVWGRVGTDLQYQCCRGRGKQGLPGQNSLAESASPTVSKNKVPKSQGTRPKVDPWFSHAQTYTTPVHLSAPTCAPLTTKLLLRHSEHNSLPLFYTPDNSCLTVPECCAN